MKNQRKIIALLIMLTISFTAFTYYPGTKTDIKYAGEWEFSFYSSADNLKGTEIITVGANGAFTKIFVLSFDGISYRTQISGMVGEDGIIYAGKLNDADNISIEGMFNGSFDEGTGKGNWGNFYFNKGTWSAKKITEQKKLK